MKVIIAVILVISSASAIGSGPYLPSGWRPKGPAFYLPSENQKLTDNPLKDTLFETEALGSEGLREYGPPQESLNVLQVLPDVVTDQIFYAVDNSAVVKEEQVAEVNLEQKIDGQEASTESVVAEVESKIQDIKLAAEVTATFEAATDKVEAEVTEKIEIATESVEIATEKIEIATAKIEIATENAEIATEQVEIVTEKVEVATDKAEIVAEVKEVEATIAAVENKLEKIIVEEEELESIVVKNAEENVVKTIEEVKNIAETLLNIEKEIKTEQIQQSFKTVDEVKVSEELSAQVADGFLEYGPPGFKEYGPPKAEGLLRSDSENEVRRRRFSPKFRPPPIKQH